MIIKRYLVFILSLLVGTALAAPPEPVPTEPAASSPVMATPIRLFQNYLSGADGHRCPMTPSCSNYALQAIQRHGTIKGWIMACDRLMRCGRDELKKSPSVMTRNGVRCQDSVQDNDIWNH